MSEKFQKVEGLLKEQGQEQLLQYNIENKEELLDEILQVNFEQINNLYKKATKKEETKETKIEPINYLDKEKMPKEEKEKYKKIGEKIIKNNQYAVVTMAGGQRNKTRA